jgi:4'-phosphopantetheinyl transferase
MREITAADFLPAHPPQALGANEIHLWFFSRWEDSSTRVVAESPYLRALLASYLDCAADDVRIERDSHGKPRLASARLQFNLSHSGGALLVGVSREQPLGVDLEMSRRSRRVLDLAQRYFHPTEVAALAALPEARQQPAFLRLWSCKEALLKAQGRGIAFGLHRVVFGLDSAGDVTGLQGIDGELAAAWCMRRLCLLPEAMGALAWLGPECSVRALKPGPIPA